MSVKNERWAALLVLIGWLIMILLIVWRIKKV